MTYDEYKDNNDHNIDIDDFDDTNEYDDAVRASYEADHEQNHSDDLTHRLTQENLMGSFDIDIANTPLAMHTDDGKCFADSIAVTEDGAEPIYKSYMSRAVNTTTQAIAFFKEIGKEIDDNFQQPEQDGGLRVLSFDALLEETDNGWIASITAFCQTIGEQAEYYNPINKPMAIAA